MLRFLFTPRQLAIHLAALVTIAGLVTLGWWQLGVYQDSQARQDVRHLPAVPLSTLATPGQPLGDAVDRAVTATGTYRAELIVPARVHEGVLGAYAVATLSTTDGVLVVLRGWQHEPTDVAPGPAGQVTVSGHLIAPELPEQATGTQPAPAGHVRYLAPDAIAGATGLSTDQLYGGYLLASDERPAPASPPERLELTSVAPIRDVSPWQNLSYWAQWWVFAGAVLVFWVSVARAEIRKRSSPPAQDDLPEPAQPPSAPQRMTSAG